MTGEFKGWTGVMCHRGRRGKKVGLGLGPEGWVEPQGTRGSRGQQPQNKGKHLEHTEKGSCTCGLRTDDHRL